MEQIKLSGTFLDEITYDIPSQNWGKDEWDRDFRTMKAIGIDTVIMIRCGLKQWVTYPSKVLKKQQQAYEPPVDLVAMFLDLSEKYGMEFYLGVYDSATYWVSGDYEKEMDLNLRVVDEVWSRYGKSPAFKGWYLCHEVSRRRGSITKMYAALAKHCKGISSGLPVLISPCIEGIKAVSQYSSEVEAQTRISVQDHEKEWNDIFAGIAGAVDIVAFQDGHVDFHELPEYLHINKTLAKKYGLSCWTNAETFDRDMPIKFLPIKWEKLLLKLRAAGEAKLEKAITFEFSHFMSPHSCYAQAHGLFKEYCQHYGIDYSRALGTK